MAADVREDTLIRARIGADVGRCHVELIETSVEIPRQARDDRWLGTISG